MWYWHPAQPGRLGKGLLGGRLSALHSASHFIPRSSLYRVRDYFHFLEERTEAPLLHHHLEGTELGFGPVLFTRCIHPIKMKILDGRDSRHYLNSVFERLGRICTERLRVPVELNPAWWMVSQHLLGARR